MTSTSTVHSPQQKQEKTTNKLTTVCVSYLYPIHSIYDMPTLGWFGGVNVGIYCIHGVFGYSIAAQRRLCSDFLRRTASPSTPRHRPRRHRGQGRRAAQGLDEFHQGGGRDVLSTAINLVGGHRYEVGGHYYYSRKDATRVEAMAIWLEAWEIASMSPERMGEDDACDVNQRWTKLTQMEGKA